MSVGEFATYLVLTSAVFLLTCALAVWLARRILKPRDSDTGMEWKNE